MWCDSNKCYSLEVPKIIKQELFGVVSLTNKISSKGKFKVVVISQKNGQLLFSEKKILTNFGVANIRLVVLFCDELPVVVARTVIPLKFIHGEFKKLTKLGSKSLGKLLHSSNNINLSFTQINKFDILKKFKLNQHRLNHSKLINQLNINPNLWARRTIYKNRSRKILVTEVFLDNYWKIIN